MNLKKLREASFATKLKVAEVKEQVAAQLGISVKDVQAKLRAGNVSGEAFDGNAKVEFLYDKKTGELHVWNPTYKVSYLRSTPFGYGGGWSSIEVQADSEEEALTKAEEMCLQKWGKLSPCSSFKVKSWD